MTSAEVEALKDAVFEAAREIAEKTERAAILKAKTNQAQVDVSRALDKHTDAVVALAKAVSNA